MVKKKPERAARRAVYESKFIKKKVGKPYTPKGWPGVKVTETKLIKTPKHKRTVPQKKKAKQAYKKIVGFKW